MDHGAFADYTALLTTEPFTPAFASGVSEKWSLRSLEGRFDPRTLHPHPAAAAVAAAAGYG